jgi:hypothetical protein
MPQSRSAGELAAVDQGLKRAIPGDASSFLGDTIPHGTLMEPGQLGLDVLVLVMVRGQGPDVGE